MINARLSLSRAQILAHRRRVGALDERLPAGAASLEHAALIGLQDSVPRSALLSIHARVADTQPSTWEQPQLVQVWGPRFSAYVIAARDRPLFTLARYPDDSKGRQRADDLAGRLDAYLDGRRMRYDDAGQALGVHPNALRYATTTGRVLIRWEGARLPLIWTVPQPDITADEARRRLARRFLNAFGPTHPASFAKWAGIVPAQARRAFDQLARELIAVATPSDDGLILASDEASFRASPSPPAPARLLPSGDPYWLLWGADRELLVPDAEHRPLLWTPRVWPGALLIDGELAGTWRRDKANVTLEPWRPLKPHEREAVELEALQLPLPAIGSIAIAWVA